MSIDLPQPAFEAPTRAERRRAKKENQKAVNGAYRVEDFTVKFSPEKDVPYIPLKDIRDRLPWLMGRVWEKNEKQITLIVGEDGEQGVFTGDFASFVEWWKSVGVKGWQ